jgi:hypothetical protein
MVELRKTGANQYEVVVDEQIIGQVWNWHGSWAAQASGKTYHGLKSRKDAIAKVEHLHRRGRWHYEGTNGKP